MRTRPLVTTSSEINSYSGSRRSENENHDGHSEVEGESTLRGQRGRSNPRPNKNHRRGNGFGKG